MAAAAIFERRSTAETMGDRNSGSDYGGGIRVSAMHDDGPSAPDAADSPLFGYGAHDGSLQLHAVLVRSEPNVPVEELDTTCRQLLDRINGGAVKLSPRDICKVDPRFASRLEPRIFNRHGVLLVSLGLQGLGAIILQDCVCLIAPNPAHRLLRSAKTCLAQRRKWRAQAAADNHTHHARLASSPRPSEVPFELMVLEALLTAGCTELHAHTTSLATHVREELAELTAHGAIQLTVGTVRSRGLEFRSAPVPVLSSIPVCVPRAAGLARHRRRAATTCGGATGTGAGARRRAGGMP